MQKARWGAPVRSRTDPPDRPGWRLYRSSCSPGASACRPPSCRAPRAIGRRRGGPASLTHPLAPPKETGGDSPGCAPPRACRADTPRYGEVRDSFGSLGVTRVRSVARWPFRFAVRDQRLCLRWVQDQNLVPQEGGVGLARWQADHRLWALRLEHRLSVWIFFARADSGRFGVPQTVTP